MSLFEQEEKRMAVKVSVIVPVYNCEKYLKDCLDSILGQTLQEIEVICINDGSLDQSGKILEEYAAKDSRVTVLSQENRGPGSSRNRGFMAARGEFIQFCDSDDMLVPQALEYSYRKSTENHLDVFYFDAVPVYENSSLEERKASYKTYYKRKPLFREIQSGADLLSSLRKHQSFRASPCLQFIRRNFLLQSQVIFPPGLIQEDNYFTSALMLCAARVSHEPEPLYIRRVRENSIMTVKESFKNVYGYFMCGMAMIDFLDAHKELAQNGKDALVSLTHQMFKSAASVYLRIDPSEQAKAAEMDEKKLAYFLAMARVEKVRIPAEVIGQLKMNPADAFFMTTLYENARK